MDANGTREHIVRAADELFYKQGFEHTSFADVAEAVGTLTTELSKLGHGSLDSATAIFTLFRSWLGEQFAALGRADDADELAMHVLAASQGIAVMSQAYRDREFTRREAGQLCAWADAQAAKEA